MAIQQMMMSPMNSIPTVIGQAYGGGYYAGQISTTADGVATHYLVVAPKTTGQIYGKVWGPINTSTGVTSIIDGPGNTAALSALGAGYVAAVWCKSLNINGYTDWYLPSRNEIAVLYYFLKPSTTLNATFSGYNSNAVSPQPINTNYTTTNPAQTSSTIFRSGASNEAFLTGGYWSSTETDDSRAIEQVFSNGQVNNLGQTKNNNTTYTRAIRRVPV